MGAQKSYRCSKGHVMRGANVGVRPGGKQAGQRYCIKCSRERSKNRYRKHEQARAALALARKDAE